MLFRNKNFGKKYKCKVLLFDVIKFFYPFIQETEGKNYDRKINNFTAHYCIEMLTELKSEQVVYNNYCIPVFAFLYYAGCYARFVRVLNRCCYFGRKNHHFRRSAAYGEKGYFAPRKSLFPMPRN